ncbi:ComEA family DNA-binding protein [Thermosipho atlanticus]|uniref:Competence protein ComEA n=1 Tax=Thermosipho atlanticus DSM 15807 TaxID=1123380 RepID=A0A1M5SRZ9_9BACT|nr:ComEA family DNA-binding protein [Thermosipho atlanticus]SHH41275.1 competence protein ComEA [Thermosipho atlanticus DSM 15807]
MRLFIEKVKDKLPVVVVIVIFIILSGTIFQEKFFKNEIQQNTSVKRNYGSQVIDINKAGYEELISLSGIGPAKAKAIINYREENGTFKSKEEIMKVSGIGNSIYEKIKERIKVENTTFQKEASKEIKKVNVNTAEKEQLEELPGIGKVKALEIIKYREQHGPFNTYEDLLSVKGIGTKTLEKIKLLIEF